MDKAMVDAEQCRVGGSLILRHISPRTGPVVSQVWWELEGGVVSG